jgi:hypothetical protein
MDLAFSRITSLLPFDLDLLSMLKFILFLAVGALVISLLTRAIFGRRSAWNHAVSSSTGILTIYAVTAVVSAFQPAGLSRYLSPLPFVQFSEGYLCILPFQSTGLSVLCAHILSLLILAFLVNAIDGLFPRGKRVFWWFVLRILSVAVAMGLHYAVNLAVHSFLPQLLVAYAPIVLVGILLGMFLLGVLNVLLSLLLIAVNPILGGIYTFFFSNILGKQLTKSMLTTVLICVLFFVLSHLGITMICISPAVLIPYLPLVIVLLGLWYLIGQLL